MEKKVIGLVEKVRIIGEKTVETYALFDTGARRSSVDIYLAAKARLGPIISTMKVRNPSFKQKVRRPVLMVKFEIAGKMFETKANIQDRSHMNLPVLIGRNIISGNFLVDTKRNRDLLQELHKRQERGEKIWRIVKSK
jgi:hypothetical protein